MNLINVAGLLTSNMPHVAVEQFEPLNRTQRLFAGVLLLLLVDVIWVVSNSILITYSMTTHLYVHVIIIT